MVLLNFSHPITPEQRAQIEKLLGRSLSEIKELRTHYDSNHPLAEQVEEQCRKINLPAQAWEGGQVLVRLPGLAEAAAVVLAWAHGMAGHFPTIVRMVPVPDTKPQQYAVEELINLQPTRDAAREQREKPERGVLEL